MSAGGASKKGRHDPPVAAEPIGVPLVDAHTHLDAIAERAGRPVSAGGVASTMAAAHAAGVVAVVTVGDSVAASRWAVATARTRDDVFAAVAVHPTEVGELAGPDVEERYAELEALARDPRCVAVGETGLDYHWDRTTPAEQQVHFRRHIELAHAVGKPLMIHDREAHEDVLRLVVETGVPPAGVVMHSFSGDETFARRCVDLGFVLSFSGVATFTNAPDVRTAAIWCPTTSMLVETDAPFLTPHPFRGRPNAPELLGWTARGIAAARGVDPGVVAAATTATAARLFPGMSRFANSQRRVDG